MHPMNMRGNTHHNPEKAVQFQKHIFSSFADPADRSALFKQLDENDREKDTQGQKNEWDQPGKGLQPIDPRFLFDGLFNPFFGDCC